MRNYSKTVGALAAASALAAGTASAEIEGEVAVGYHNMYEFRFVDLGDNLVTASADVAWEYAGFGLSAGAWYASWDGYGFDSFGLPVSDVQSDELDLYGGVSFEVAGFSVEVGYIYYYFPDGGGNTQEVYVGAGYELPFGLSFSSTWFYDFDEFNGWYWDNSIGYSIAFNDCLSLDLGAGVAFADGQDLQWNVNNNGSRDGFQGWYLSASLPWGFRENMSLTPYVKYTDGDSDLVTDLAGNGGQEHVVAGVSLSVGF